MTTPISDSRLQAREIGVGLLGLGVVGSGVARVLTERKDAYERRAGRRLELRRILIRDEHKARQDQTDAALLTTDPDAVLNDPEIQIVVEVMGGEHPAYDYIRRALASGRYVVTANKEVIAKHGPELLSLARANGVDILFEASAGGGIPLIAPLKRDLLGNEVGSMRAIVNGTTNYILTRMSNDGLDFGDALAQAQALGYAEADPANDVEGIDAAYKLAILASLAFRSAISPQEVYHEGITRLTANDFQYARELGYAIKLLAIGRRHEDGSVMVRVHPALLREDEPLAKVDGVFNAVELEGDLLGLVLFQGRGAGSLPTTSAIIADLIDAARSIALGQNGRAVEPYAVSAPIRPFGELESRYYLRIRVPDRAGVLSKICGVLGDRHGISISDIIQKETSQDDQTAEIVIMTHAAREGAMRVALTELEELPVVTAIGNFIRVESSR
ncbi:MAG TPA: homoserine dehydrogenase [Dehalococcoidia bacterium]|nr:homoserine dehydrogenase [Dehalococcoidia bacterium]